MWRENSQEFTSFLLSFSANKLRNDAFGYQSMSQQTSKKKIWEKIMREITLEKDFSFCGAKN